MINYDQGKIPTPIFKYETINIISLTCTCTMAYVLPLNEYLWNTLLKARWESFPKHYDDKLFIIKILSVKVDEILMLGTHELKIPSLSSKQMFLSFSFFVRWA